MTHIELKQKLQNKLDLANVEFTKVVNYIKENIEMFESMNLKLYYAAVMDFSKYPWSYFCKHIKLIKGDVFYGRLLLCWK